LIFLFGCNFPGDDDYEMKIVCGMGIPKNDPHHKRSNFQQIIIIPKASKLLFHLKINKFPCFELNVPSIENQILRPKIPGIPKLYDTENVHH
jgi:hypothetical protein